MSAPAAAVTWGDKSLSERSLKVWRAVASGRGKPLAAAAIAERAGMKGDLKPLYKTLDNMTVHGYLRKLPREAGIVRYLVTTKLPLGEEVPLWMQGTEADDAGEPAPPPAQVDARRIGPLGSAFSAAPTWPFEGPVIPHPAALRARPTLPARGPGWRPPAVVVDDPAPAAAASAAPATEAEPLFALYSDGRLMLQQPGQEPLTLAAETTRALFRWLDRLQSATSFAETAEEAS